MLRARAPLTQLSCTRRVREADRDTQGNSAVGFVSRCIAARGWDSFAAHAATGGATGKELAVSRRTGPPIARRSGVRALLIAGVGVLAALATAGSAHAAPPVPFSIDEQIDFDAGVFEFTATSPLCDSGTFEDEVTVGAFPHSDHAQTGGFNLVIRTTYTCDDGSGTFDALKHVFITFTESGFTNVGPTQLIGGTGDYSGIVGHGVNVGATDDATGTGGGTITGFIRVP
jgi:hypothetical protein